MSELNRFVEHFLFSWPQFNSDSFTQNCRLNSDWTVGPSITYIFQTQFISVIFQVQLNLDSLLQCINSVHLDSIIVNWIGIDWWIKIELYRSVCLYVHNMVIQQQTASKGSPRGIQYWQLIDSSVNKIFNCALKHTAKKQYWKFLRSSLAFTVFAESLRRCALRHVL